MGNDLYIIGNGFDIHHGLKSRYSDYRRWLKGYRQTLYRHIKLFYGSPNYVWWRDFEEHLADIRFDKYLPFLLSLTPTEQRARLIEYSKEYGVRALPLLQNNPPSEGYSSSELAELICFEIRIMLDEISASFRDWVNDFDPPSTNKMVNCPQSAYYISFNYTDVLETLYLIPKNQICHIHGACYLWTDLVFGHGKEKSALINNLFAFINKRNKRPPKDIIRLMEEIVDNISNQLLAYKKGVKNLINKKLDNNKAIASVDTIYIFGLSFSTIDQPYLEHIINRLEGEKVKWFVSIYELNNPDKCKADKERVEVFFKSNKVQHYQFVDLEQMSEQYHRVQ